jgi:hypothetical protein
LSLSFVAFRKDADEMAGWRRAPRDSLWQVSLSDSHCSARYVLGDVGGEWIVWATGWAMGSTAELGPEYTGTPA